ncbi:PREDICTED: uncharacterized protein LOC106898491 [Calidris pugnax]|uniref:uncharacterized protein LOC106898491 n=1 Tax=Calidris pugnax TaxID=198806 RepID=UPI00071D7B22|nr:PREDICTED: uncharacterized protein LOC106898491 [Calidris pugnax]
MEEPGMEESGTEESGTEEPGVEEPGEPKRPLVPSPGPGGTFPRPGGTGPGLGTEESGLEEPGMEERGMEESGTEESGTEEPGVEEPGEDTSDDEDHKDQPHEDLAGTAVTNWQQDGNHQEESEEPRDSGRGQVEVAQLSLEPSTTERQEGKAGSDLSWSPRTPSDRKRKFSQVYTDTMDSGSVFDSDEEEEEFETPKRILLDRDVTLPDIPLPPIQASWDPLPAPESQTSEKIRRGTLGRQIGLKWAAATLCGRDWMRLASSLSLGGWCPASGCPQPGFQPSGGFSPTCSHRNEEEPWLGLWPCPSSVFPFGLLQLKQTTLCLWSPRQGPLRRKTGPRRIGGLEELCCQTTST